MKRLRRFFPAALALLFVAATPLRAAEGEQSPADSTIGWVFRWLNFVLVFGVLSYWLAKKAPAAFRRRAESIVSAITEASRVKEEAERRRSEAEAKLAGLDQEIAELRAAARRDAQADAERLRALAREEAQKIERAADAEIRAAERAARADLKGIGARLAVDRAEATLRKELTPAADAALIRGFVADLERSVN
jgi:F-type H+-transporting ATPase subunit b